MGTIKNNNMFTARRVLQKAKMLPLRATRPTVFASLRGMFTQGAVQKTRITQGVMIKQNARCFSNLPYHIKLEMPNLSPTMETGNIKSWGLQVGDEVKPGDVLAAIETDKATIDYEMQEEGYIAKLMYPAGAKDVELMKTIAILVENKEDIAAFANYTDDAEAPVASEPVAAAAPPESAAQANLPWHVVLEMPNLSPTMEKGNVVSWSKAVGDEVNPGDVLAAIETDKATIDYEM